MEPEVHYRRRLHQFQESLQDQLVQLQDQLVPPVPVVRLELPVLLEQLVVEASQA
jgi:hypothetical protein